MERPIAEVLFLEADRERHADLLYMARAYLERYMENRPRIDSGEGLINVQEKIDDEQWLQNETESPPLRRVTIEYEDGKPVAVLEPFPGPFPWETGRESSS
jgi:hypothetical protein